MRDELDEAMAARLWHFLRGVLAADRGLVITTGTFSREARAEATRDRAPPIDLVDGEQLLDKLKELRLGVGVKMIEEVTVLPEWFTTI
jgi:restriction system protein